MTRNERRLPRKSALASTIGLGCLIVAVIGPSAVSADTGPGGESKPTKPNPLTPEQAAWRDEKLAILGQRTGSGADVGAMMMPPPDDPGFPGPNELKLNIKPRHQWRYFFCGPATVQVLSNYAWGYAVAFQEGGQDADANKYKQKYINSTWLHATGSTGVPNVNYLVTGLNEASNESGFYALTVKPAWDTFHAAVVIDTYYYDLGAAAGVNPKKTGANHFLFSWRNVPEGDFGHFIALTGYTKPGATSSSMIHYHDSSGGTDQETGEIIYGSTGNFSDLSFTVYKTMMNRYGNLIW